MNNSFSFCSLYVFLEGKTFSLIIHFLIWSHLSNCGSTCMGVGLATNLSFHSFQINNVFQKKCSKSSFMCSINPAGLVCKNCDFTLSVILGDPGSVSWVGKKGATKVFKQARAWKLSVRLVRKFFCWLYFDIGKTVEPRLTATSLQRPTLYNGHFFWRTVHTFTLVSSSLQWPLYSVPKVAVVERINCIQLSPEWEVIEVENTETWSIGVVALLITK